MITFTSLTFKNFLSYGAVPTTIALDTVGSTLILGKNLDNTSSGDGANGTGKSVIINALSYAIYDKPISNISLDNLVNNINKKGMEVSLSFTDTNDSYVISRYRKTKSGAAGNYARLTKNGKDITPASVANTNKLIETIIGITYEIFVRVSAFSATRTPFFDLPVRSAYAANQTSIIEGLFGLTSISDKATTLKAIIKDTEQALLLQRTKSELITKEHKLLESQILSATKRKGDWDTTNKNKILVINADIKKLKSINVEHQLQLHALLNETDNKLSTNKQQKRKLVAEVNHHKKIKNKLTSEIEHLLQSECPYCKQAFINTETKLEVCKKDISDIDNTNQALLTDIDVIEQCISTLEHECDELSSDIIIDDKRELSRLQNDAHNNKDKLVELKSAINPFIEPLEELCATTLDEIDNELSLKLETTIAHQKFLLKLLTKKDSFIRKALLNKNIPFLNSRLHHYVLELGLPHVVEFTHEMTAKISQFGRLLDFGNLSSGQRARVNLALSLAFRDIIQTSHGNSNVCMFDEVLDVGLDAVGIQLAAKILKRKAEDENLSMFVISHRDEIRNIFDNKLMIQMSNGFSTAKLITE